MSDHDPTLTGEPPAITPAPEPARWRFPAGASITGRAALAGETAFVGAHDGCVHALDVRSGAARWSSEPLGGAVEGGPAVAGDALIVPVSDGHLCVLDAHTGQVRRRWPVGGRLRSAPIIHRGLACVGSEDGAVVALVFESGQRRAVWRAGRGVRATPAVWGDLLLFTSRDGTLYAVDIRRGGGQPVWTFATHHQLLGSPVVDERAGRAYVGSLDGGVYAVDRHGRLAWPQPFRTGGQVIATPALAEGILYVGASDNRLYALDVASGEMVWDQPFVVGDWIVSDPVVWSGLVFFGCNDGHVYAVDAASGERFWRFPAGSAVHAPPLVTDEGLVVVGTAEGMVHALPWCLNHFRPAAERLERREQWVPAGEMWRRAGDVARAVRCFLAGRAFAQAGRVAVASGLYREAAEAYERAAQACGSRQDEAATHYRAAAEAWEADRRPDDAHRCRVESARLRRAPLLVLRPVSAPPATLGDVVPLEIEVANEGPGEAWRVVVVARGRVHEQREHSLGRLRSGERRSVRLDVKPSESGTARVTVTAAYDNAAGQPEPPATCEVTVQVQPRPVVTTEEHFHGPVIRGDGVIISRGSGGEARPGEVRITGDGVILAGGHGEGDRQVRVQSNGDGVVIQRPSGDGVAERRLCARCHTIVPAGEACCPNCGLAVEE